MVLADTTCAVAVCPQTVLERAGENKNGKHLEEKGLRVGARPASGGEAWHAASVDLHVTRALASGGIHYVGDDDHFAILSRLIRHTLSKNGISVHSIVYVLQCVKG